MDALIRDGLPWALSALTIWALVLAGRQHPLAWALGFVIQVPWAAWIIYTEAWGLLPMNVGLALTYGWNHVFTPLRPERRMLLAPKSRFKKTRLPVPPLPPAPEVTPEFRREVEAAMGRHVERARQELAAKPATVRRWL